jgi:hypothetical protein
MDEPERFKESGDHADNEEPRLFPKAFFNIGKDQRNRTTQSPKKGWKRLYRRWWGQFTPDRRIEIFLAGAITFFALGQWITSCQNNESTTQQTDQLIRAAKYGAYAADRNAQAAQSFAVSADKINNGIDNAVGKLNLQAQATSDVADAGGKQADAANAIATTAQEQATTAQEQLEATTRPWLAPANVPALVPMPESPIPELREQIRKSFGITIKVSLRNYGHSPAVFGPPAFGLFNVSGSRHVNLRPAESKMCENIQTQVLNEETNTAFPEGASDVSVGKEDTPPQEYGASWEKLDGEPISPEPQYLVGCVGYQGLGKTIYHTSFVYEIQYRNPDSRTPHDPSDIIGFEQKWITGWPDTWSKANCRSVICLGY